MNRDNAQLKFEYAQNTHAEAIETIKAFKRGDSDKTINQAWHKEREAWKRLSAARREFIDACLESIGR